MTPEQKAAEHKRLAHSRTLLMLAAAKVAAVPEGHRLRRDMDRKLNTIKGKLRAQELDHEAGK
jgi:hypothetical protein